MINYWITNGFLAIFNH